MNRTDLDRLAEQFMGRAVKVQPGDNVWVEYLGPDAEPLGRACQAYVERLGAKPHMVDSGSMATNALLGKASQADIDGIVAEKLAIMHTMQGYIRVRAEGEEEKITVSQDRWDYFERGFAEVTKWRINNTRWLVVSTPSRAFARACGMNLSDFERFYRNVCLLDYSKMAAAAQPLADLMMQTDRVRLVGPHTDLSFSIRDIPAIVCAGKCNIPDGEVYNAPVRNSVNGRILYGPSNYDRQRFGSVALEFNNGKIVRAFAATVEGDLRKGTDAVNEILDRDEGARYVGEFAIAFNPYVLHPMGDILFDEKIAGSIHFTPGNAYDDADNGNRSAVHWDLVHIQRPEYGGGEVWFDDRLVRRDGLFLPRELQGLNPENLLA